MSNYILCILLYIYYILKNTFCVFGSLPFIFLSVIPLKPIPLRPPHLIALGAPSYATNSYFSFSKVGGEKTWWPGSWETWPLRLHLRMPRKISHHSVCWIVTRAGNRKPPVGWGFSAHFNFSIIWGGAGPELMLSDEFNGTRTLWSQ